MESTILYSSWQCQKGYAVSVQKHSYSPDKFSILALDTSLPCWICICLKSVLQSCKARWVVNYSLTERRRHSRAWMLLQTGGFYGNSSEIHCRGSWQLACCRGDFGQTECMWGLTICIRSVCTALIPPSDSLMCTTVVMQQPWEREQQMVQGQGINASPASACYICKALSWHPDQNSQVSLESRAAITLKGVSIFECLLFLFIVTTRQILVVWQGILLHYTCVFCKCRV